MQTQYAADLDAQIRPMMTWMSRSHDDAEMRAKGNEFIMQFPPERAISIATAMSFANPFFLPDVPDAAARDLAIPLETLAEIVMRAKLTANRAPQVNILVACAPKSASTFIQAALMNALKLPQACLFTTGLDWSSAGALGAALREQELDELALIQNGLNKRGYVAQHHARCTPYMSRLLSTYGIKPIVTYRNIFDTIVSMDDMVMEWRTATNLPHRGFFSDAMPSNFETLERADRLLILAHRWAAWLLQFYISWRKCARIGVADPMFISYEDDFLANRMPLSNRLAEYIGVQHVQPDALYAALTDDSDAKAKRINHGVAGRGRDMPEKVRQFILDAARDYTGEDDLSPMIGSDKA